MQASALPGRVQQRASARVRWRLAVAITDQLKQQMGFAHGGVVSYLADNALTYAGGTAMRVPVVTSEYKINYVRPAVGDRLVARARAVLGWTPTRSLSVQIEDALRWRRKMPRK